MPTLFRVADDHQKSRIALAEAASLDAMKLWAQGDVRYLDASWQAMAPEMVDIVAEAQVSAARQAESYLAEATRALETTAPEVRINPERFSNVTDEGRELGAALFGSVTTTKTLIGHGVGADKAFQAGAAFLAAVAKTAIADMGRESDRVTATAKNYTRYVRVVSPGACSRCAILAGKGEYKVAFKRHPACKCTSAPVLDNSERVPPGFFSSPQDYFDSLTPAEQDRIFGKSDALAIRDGADFSQVVNARRNGIAAYDSGLRAPLGYDGNGRPIRVTYTSEGTTVRGAYGRASARRGEEAKKAAGDRYRRTTSLRLMPSTLYDMARGDQAKAIELLKQYGYIL